MENQRSPMDLAREAYSGLTELRVAVQLVPIFGGAIDTLIQGRTSQIQQARIEDLLKHLAIRMQGVERIKANLQDEAFSDLVLAAFRRAARTRSSEKRGRFAQILRRQAVAGEAWDEAEAAMALLSDLQEHHIQVLEVSLAAPVASGHKAFAGHRLVALAGREKLLAKFKRDLGAVYLSEALPHLTPLVLQMSVIDLVSRGLLHDLADNTVAGAALELFAATDAADWFAKWVRPD